MSTPSPSVSIHALVVDDDPNVRGVVVRLLTRQFEGLRVTEATNGLEALECLSRERFTIALLDLAMPIVDGMDVLETIRRHPALRGMAVVMFTGQHDVATVRRIMDLGVDDYVLKPVQPAALLERVARVLARESLGTAGQLLRPGFSPIEFHADTSVLMVDGSEELRELVRRVMSPMCRVHTAASGLEAFRFCLESPPDAVFLGPDLGVLTSEVLVRKIRQHAGLRGVRLIGIEPPRTLLQARKRGALDAVILQSFVPEVFLEGLKSLLARPGKPSRLMGSVPDLKLLAIGTCEEVLSAALGQQVVLRPQQTDRRKPMLVATAVLDTGPDGPTLLLTISAAARRLGEVASRRDERQTAEELLGALIERLGEGLAGELVKRGLQVSCETPIAVRNRTTGGALPVTPHGDDRITFDFDVPAERLVLSVDLAETEDVDHGGGGTRGKAADAA